MSKRVGHSPVGEGMELLNKLAATVGLGQSIPKDEKLESHKAKLQRLLFMIETLQKSFSKYAEANVELLRVGVQVARDVGEFYRESPPRAKSAADFANSQATLQASANMIYKDEFTWEVLKAFDDWTEQVYQLLDKIKVAEQVRQDWVNLAVKVKGLREKVERGQLVGKELNAFEAAKNQEEQLSKKLQSMMAAIDANVGKMIDGRFATFDQCFVRMMESQLDFFRAANTVAQVFAPSVDNYRKKYPRQASGQGPRPVRAAPGDAESLSATATAAAPAAAAGDEAKAAPPKAAESGQTPSQAASQPAPKPKPPIDLFDVDGDTASPQPQQQQKQQRAPQANGSSAPTQPPGSGVQLLFDFDAPVSAPAPKAPTSAVAANLAAALGDGASAPTTGSGAAAGGAGVANSSPAAAAGAAAAPSAPPKSPHPQVDLLDLDGPPRPSPSPPPVATATAKQAQPSSQRQAPQPQPQPQPQPASNRSAKSGQAAPAQPVPLKRQGTSSDFDPFKKGLGAAPAAPQPPRAVTPQEHVADDEDIFHRMPTQEAPKSAPVEKDKASKAADLWDNSYQDSMDPNALSSGRPLKSPKELEAEHDEYLRTRKEGQSKTEWLIDRNQREALQELRDREQAEVALQEEKRMVKDLLERELTEWEFKNGVRKNLRTLLSTLHNVLWKDSEWKPVSMTDLMDFNNVKKVYRKAIMIVHPDKVGGLPDRQVIAKYVFEALNTSWKLFEQSEQR